MRHSIGKQRLSRSDTFGLIIDKDDKFSELIFFVNYHQLGPSDEENLVIIEL